MPWFKIDDNLAFHHKVVAAGNAAMGLWARAGSWCAQNLTDGFVPDHMLARLGTPSQVEKLVRVGLWNRVEGGIEFHQWANRQPLRTQIEAEREASRTRMASVRAAKKGVKNTSSQVSEPRSPEVQRTGSDAFGNPDPTHPDPSNYFDEFWSAYPRKESKGHARKAWASALKKADAKTIIEAAGHFANRVKGSDKKFIAHPATWLNGERWADEVDTADAQADEGGWFQPFTLPACPPEIADDPVRYEEWVDEQRQAWQQAGGDR